jgi:hypothetical protein
VVIWLVYGAVCVAKVYKGCVSIVDVFSQVTYG